MVLCISCRYAAAENGIKTSVPLRNTLRTPLTSPTDVLSIEIQSIVGCGVPELEQSNHPPDEFEKSKRDGGSTREIKRFCFGIYDIFFLLFGILLKDSV